MVFSDRAVYATQPQPLDHQIQQLILEADVEPIHDRVLAAIVPDNNLLLGGEVAAKVFKSIREQHIDTVLVISPSHTGEFRRITIPDVETYYTPLGSIVVNDDVCHELCDEDDDIYLDNTGHFHNAGIDVQLPFLQRTFKRFDLVPIVMGEESRDYCVELGNAVGQIMANRRAMVVASADITTGSTDVLQELSAGLQALDVDRVAEVLNDGRLQIMGKGAVLVALLAALDRRAVNAHMLHVSEPYNGTPGFIGAVLTRP